MSEPRQIELSGHDNNVQNIMIKIMGKNLKSHAEDRYKNASMGL